MQTKCQGTLHINWQQFTELTLKAVKAVANRDWGGGGKSQASRHTQCDVDTVSARRLENARQTDLATLAVRGHILAHNILDLPTGGVGHYGAGHRGNTEKRRDDAQLYWVWSRCHLCCIHLCWLNDFDMYDGDVLWNVSAAGLQMLTADQNLHLKMLFTFWLFMMWSTWSFIFAYLKKYICICVNLTCLSMSPWSLQMCWKLCQPTPLKSDYLADSENLEEVL